MKLHVYVGGLASANGYVLETGDNSLVVIDASHGITEWLARKFPEHTVTHLLITHSHFDHVMDAAALQAKYNCQIVAQSPYEDNLTLAKNARSSWGIDLTVVPYRVDFVLGKKENAGDWGGMEWSVKYVPGHSIDSVNYYLKKEGVVFTGDTIFANSIGRTDLPGGDMEQLVKNLRRHVLSLPRETVILPGHGSETTVDIEDRMNPFL